MKKNFALAVMLVLILSALTIMAASAGGAKNGTYFEWKNGNYFRSGYFKATGSGIVHMWSYDREGFGNSPGGDVHFVFKPLDKFPNATCEPGTVKEVNPYSPVGLGNAIGNPPAFWHIFETEQDYLMCAYQMD